jgi:hypothetical protein
MGTMNAEERRAWHEQAIDDGGSVFHAGQIIQSKGALPSKGDMATTEQERYEALADLENERQALNDKEARIRSAQSTVKDTKVKAKAPETVDKK